MSIWVVSTLSTIKIWVIYDCFAKTTWFWTVLPILPTSSTKSGSTAGDTAVTSSHSDSDEGDSKHLNTVTQWNHMKPSFRFVYKYETLLSIVMFNNSSTRFEILRRYYMLLLFDLGWVRDFRCFYPIYSNKSAWNSWANRYRNDHRPLPSPPPLPRLGDRCLRCLHRASPGGNPSDWTCTVQVAAYARTHTLKKMCNI